MTLRFARLRRFRFNLPQRIAAGMLLLFLAQGFWLISRQTLSDRDYQYARCGRETWEKPSPLAGYFTSCGNIHDGILAYRLAGLPLTLNLLAERGLDHFRKPEDRVVQQQGPISTLGMWELRHQLTHILLLLRLPFLFAGVALGGGLWWVTRRLYGDFGGYTALALYCFSPPILKACVSPSPEVLAALGVYAAVYTCIGVAHAMQGPRKNPGPPATGLRRWGGKWRPRIVLLTAALGLAAAAHIAALPIAALLGLVFMLWVAEGRRSQVLPIVLMASAGALLLLFAAYGFSPDAFSYVFRSAAGFVWFSLDPARRFFSTLSNAGITVAAAAALLLYVGVRRSRYFGNTAPLLCVLVCFLLVMTGAQGSPWLWALPFLLTFIGGVFADAYETPRGRIALAAAGAIVTLQAIFCLLSLPGLI
ncbi:MAG TPA: hypothetical protein VE291_05655 [Terracidiphilus sp.]|nr:hypothetical protein [Terracidiphilus sp.]